MTLPQPLLEATVRDAEPTLPRVLGRTYQLERVLSRGGAGAVFYGTHLRTGRSIAVKVLHEWVAGSTEFRRRFRREALVTTRLRHPAIVEVLDMGEEPDGTMYLVMEHLDGEHLGRYLRAHGPLDLEATWALLEPVMEALAEAHAAGVVHRDLKPSNVVVVGQGRAASARLLDFGIALEQGGEALTRRGETPGTPRYMSPERWTEDAPAGPPADVWSMGLLFHRCLTGRLPFERHGAGHLVGAVLFGPLPSLVDLVPDAPPALAAAVDRALERDPARRHPDMAAFLAAVREARASRPRRAPPRPSRPPPFVTETIETTGHPALRPTPVLPPAPSASEAIRLAALGALVAAVLLGSLLAGASVAVVWGRLAEEPSAPRLAPATLADVDEIRARR